jgi:hypothetical protein
MTMLPLFAAVVLATSPVSLQFEGPLKDAVKAIAEKGGLNVVVAGPLDETVQLRLSDVTAEEALESIAKAYRLEVTHEGKLWIVRPGGAAPAIAPAAAAAPTSAAMAPSEAVEPDEHAQAVAEEARERAEERLSEARELAEDLAQARRDMAETAAQAERDMAQAASEVARAHEEVQRQRVNAGGPVRVERGAVVDTAVAYGGPVVIEEGAVVKGDAVAFGGDVVLEKNAVVRGDAVSFGGSIQKDPTAQVQGASVNFGGVGLGNAIVRSVVKTQRAQDMDDEAKAPSDERSDEPSAGQRIASFLFGFSGLFGLGFLLLVLAPRRMQVLEANLRDEPVKNGLAGFLGLIATIPATVLLVVTLVGIPVAILMWPALAFLIAVGLVAIAHRLGASLPLGRATRTQALVLAAGTLVVMGVAQIPVLGPFAVGCAGVVGLGAVLRTRFGQPPRGTPVIESPSSQPIAG